MGEPPPDQRQGPLLLTAGARTATVAGRLALPAILLAAAGLRFHDLGGLSLWYDEVVTMTLARSSGPSELFARLAEIDATRAPLHPLLLQGWLGLFGVSDAAGRAFSALCGVLTVGLVYRLGLACDRSTARWSALLAAISPMLVYYDREARMYAWLVALTCLGWVVLIEGWGHRAGRFGYAACLVALGYSHPLGLLMGATLALEALGWNRLRGLSWRAWLWPQALAGVLLLPWLGRYLDHPPEYTVGSLPFKFLLGTPIGFVGGNFATLGLLGLVIGWGIVTGIRDAGEGAPTRRVVVLSWLDWFLIPPILLYVYSIVGHPIFGPNRYTVYVAPAFLLLIGRGLACLPAWLRWPAGLATVGLSLSTLPGMVYAPGLKADWRAAAVALADVDPAEPLVVTTSDPGSKNLETITAGYYLGATRKILAMPAQVSDLSGGAPAYWLAVGLRDGRPTVAWPESPAHSRVIDLPGLRLIRVP